MWRTLAGNPATVIVGFAYRTATLPTIGGIRIVSLAEGATPNYHFELRFTNSLQLDAWCAGAHYAYGQTLLTNTWYYLEAKVTINNSGSFEVRVNGQTDISGSTDTQTGSNAYADRLYLGGTAGATQAATVDYDDVYVCDNSGGVNDDFRGDSKVETLFPNGNGNYSQFTGSDGNSTDNYLLVDEVTPNDDTDYVEDATNGDFDTYALTNLATTSGVVYGVQTNLLARKTDAGSRNLASVRRLSSTDDVSSDHSLLDTYSYWVDIRDTKPGGGSWSISDVNSLEAGQKITS